MKDTALGMIQEGKSHRQIQKALGVPLATISRWRNDGGGRVLVVGDPHEPCSREGYLDFCVDTQKKYKANKTVIIGDIAEHSVISFHDRHPEQPGAQKEYELTKGKIKQWEKAFPNAIVTIGNHDDRPGRLARSVNILPETYLKGFNEIWETKRWQWVDDVIIDGVYYFHGIGYSGMYPSANAAKHMGMSCVMGHSHSVAGINWFVSPEKRWFGMSVGCGVDDKKYAFIYGKHMKRKSVISCGIVIDGHPYLELMPLEKYK